MKTSLRLVGGVVFAVAVLLGALPGAVFGVPLVVLVGEVQSTDNLNELMKITFDDTVIPEVITDTELMDILPDGEVKRGSEGRWFETSQLYQSPGSFGSRSEGGYIPTPVPAKAENARINLKKILGSLDATAETLKKIKGSKAAFVDWAREQFPHFKESLADEYDRQALGDGSGIRARVNMAEPATTLLVNRTYGITGLDQTLMQFQVGLNLRASPNADGSSPRAGVMRVEQIDWDTGAIVVDQLATSLANNDYLFEGDAADNSVGKDMMGLLGLIDDGGIVETLQNIDRSEHLWFRSYVHDVIDVHGSGTTLSESVLIRADRLSRFRGGGKISHLILSEDGFDQVWENLKLDRAINDPRSYTGGRKGVDIMFGGTRVINLRTARKMPSKLGFGLQADQLRKFMLHEWEWDDTTGSTWKQIVDANGRRDEFYAYGSSYGELAVKSAQRSWRIENWADPA